MSKREYGLVRYWKRLELIQLCCRLSLPLILSMAPSPIKWRPRQIWWLERLWRGGGGKKPGGAVVKGRGGHGRCSVLFGSTGGGLALLPAPRSSSSGPSTSL